MTTTMAEPREACLSFDIIDQAAIDAEQHLAAGRAASTVLSLTQCAIDFASVERVPRYNAQRRENDAEHSFMLSLIAPEIAAQFFPHLDPGLVALFCNVHDLIELETKDAATYALDDTALAAKEAAELAALDQLARKLPPHTRALLLRYEAQTEPEARFVRHFEKQLPIAVDILGPGKQVMAEDYGITTRAERDANERRFSERLRKKFPEAELAFVHLMRDLLAEQFAAEFDSLESAA